MTRHALPVLVLFVVLFAVFVLATAASLAFTPALAASDARAPARAEPHPGRLDRVAALIRTRAELDAYLAGPRGASDPLAPLSTSGRARFLASLRFGPHGLVAFQADALQLDLSAAQAWRLLALFGLQSALAAMPPLAVRSPDDAEVDAWRREASPDGSP